MKKIIPVLTEKSLKDAKEGKFTFKVSKKLNKHQARQLVEKIFKVNVVKVRSMNEKDETRVNYQRQKKVVRGMKKIVVNLKDDQKIDIFDSN